MSDILTYHAAATLDCTTSTLVCSLPTELVMDILDLAALHHRRDELRWSLTLSLISHPVRASVLPVLYETLFLDVKKLKANPCVGWDGRSHAHAQLSFLSYLIHNPNAPPRRYVKHLIFRHDGDFNAADLRWDDDADKTSQHDSSDSNWGDTPEPQCLWTIERLTTRFRLDAKQLHTAGIYVAYAQHLSRVTPVNGTVDTHLLSRLMSIPGRLNRYRGKTFYRTWVMKDDEDPPHGALTLFGLVQSDLDPSDMRRWLATAKDAQHDTLIVLDLTEGDGFAWSPVILFEDIVEMLSAHPSASVVLAYKPSLRIGGHTMEDLVRNATPMLIPLDLLERIHFSHQTWDRTLELNDAFMAFVRMVIEGRNPWDQGRRLMVDD